MTKYQLNNLFDHFHLPRIYGENEISELKKLLLLELKSSDSQTILIGPDVWTKNDVIRFFDRPLTEGFDIQAFYEKYPWAELITTPQKITNIRGLTSESFEDPLFDTFRRETAVHFEQAFLKLIKELMTAKKDAPISTLLHYLGCFQYEFQNQVLTTLRSMMNTRLKTLSVNMKDPDPRFKNKETELIFIKQHGYYQLLAKIGDSDNDLILQNLETLSDCLNHMSVQAVNSVIKQQRNLPLPPHGIQFLDELQLQVDKILKQRGSTSDSTSSDSGAGKTIGYIVSAIVGLIIAFSRCNQHHNNRIDTIEMQQFQQNIQQMQQQQNQVNVEHVGDSIRIIQNGDTMYTTMHGLLRTTDTTTY